MVTSVQNTSTDSSALQNLAAETFDWSALDKKHSAESGEGSGSAKTPTAETADWSSLTSPAPETADWTSLIENRPADLGETSNLIENRPAEFGDTSGLLQNRVATLGDTSATVENRPADHDSSSEIQVSMLSANAGGGTNQKGNGVVASTKLPNGGTIEARVGADVDVKSRTTVDAFFKIRSPSETLAEIDPPVGVIPPSVKNPSVGVPDKLLVKVPYLGPVIAAIPGEKKDISVAGELRSGRTASGEETNIAQVTVSLNSKSKLGSNEIGKIVAGAIDKLPLSDTVRNNLKKGLVDQVGKLVNMPGVDGKPITATNGDINVKGAIQFDVVVETAKNNPLDVKSVEVYAGIKAGVSISSDTTFPGMPVLPKQVRDTIKVQGEVTLEAAAHVSVRYEAPTNQKPPTVIDKREQFTRLNNGNTRQAFQITEELLQGVASVRHSDGSVQHGVVVSEGTSVWDLSNVAKGRNHGHAALDLANRANNVIDESGLPHGRIRTTEQATAAIQRVFASASPEERREMAADLANPMGINFGIKEIADANRALEARNGPLPTAAHFRSYF